MNISYILRNFSRDEDGAVTVDWVVLTAAITVMAIAVVATIQSGANSSATLVNSGISSYVASALT